jgi:transcriptional regulator with XRE-family HTH domain
MGNSSSLYKDFAENLRRMSVDKGSIAQVCRELGMNRQQFNKYLAGTTLPGAASLEKLANYFGVDERTLFKSPTAGLSKFNDTGVVPPLSLNQLREGILPAVLKGLSSSRDVQLREGCYLTYFPWIPKPSGVVRSVMVVFKVGEITCFRRYTSVRLPTNPKVRYTHGRHDGIVIERNGRTFMLAQNTRGFGELSLTSFGSASSPLLTTMPGIALVFAVAEPAAMRTTVEYFGKLTDFRKALKLCGILPDGSPEIPESMKRSLTENEKLEARVISPFVLFEPMES